MTEQSSAEIVTRSGLDFRLDADDIPRHWLGGDAFRSRFFDALSTLFPEGEKYFIECVRNYRDQVTDPELQAQVKDFIYQEAQHGRIHTDFNNRLAQQGIDIDDMIKQQQEVLGDFLRRRPAAWNLAHTAAAEHITAMMGHYLLNNREELADADPRIRAIYFWHAVEEVEHKAVTYDVMKKVAQVGYFKRVAAMAVQSLVFPYYVFRIMRYMLRVDGFSRSERVKIWMKGLWYLYGPRGVFTRMMPHYLSYYLPGFHPWKRGEMGAYRTWREHYERSGGNPLTAADELLAAA